MDVVEWINQDTIGEIPGSSAVFLYSVEIY